MLMPHSSVFARRLDNDYVKLYDLIAEGRAPYLQQNARKFPSLCSSDWDFFSLTEPFTCNIWQHFLIFSMKCIFSRNNSNNFKLGIVSYPNYWKTLPSMSQLKHKCRKDDAILRDVSCCTTCKKLHFTYLFFYQTKRSFAAVVLSQVEISLLNEQASKTMTRLATATKFFNWALWNAARCAIIHPLVGTHDCVVRRNYHEHKKAPNI